MVRQTRWVERTFDFNFPLGLFPCILERLRGTPPRLEEFLRLVPQTIYTVRIGDSWSIQEHVGHLFDLDELHDGRIDDYREGKTLLRAADLENRKTKEANHNAHSMDTILRNFRAARHHFIYRLENLDDDMIARVSEHPRLKQPMRLVDMAYFVAEHDDHHLARIAAIARQLLKK
ncbi:MAG: DinB family protein [Ignavibacteriales bacterium]|nr:DinB family protein [Ignavibacteriales bacterium]